MLIIMYLVPLYLAKIGINRPEPATDHPKTSSPTIFLTTFTHSNMQAVESFPQIFVSSPFFPTRTTLRT